MSPTAWSSKEAVILLCASTEIHACGSRPEPNLYQQGNVQEYAFIHLGWPATRVAPNLEVSASN